mmetsp:Transcript_8901/g.32828  ORF Transcript_8901/g.32828 Transcript_8901/m.32828 type:complete len:341 (+) Transcript_8901:245-1267(+)
MVTTRRTTGASSTPTATAKRSSRGGSDSTSKASQPASLTEQFVSRHTNLKPRSWKTATPEEKRLKLRAIKKDYIILACLLVAGSTYAFKRFRPESAPAPALEPHPLGVWVIPLAFFNLVMMAGSQYCDVALVPPPHLDDYRCQVCKPFGHIVFLTFQLLTICTAYSTFSFLAEASRYLGYSGLTPLLQLSYQVAPVISGFGQTLTLLFLKFCWFEETYQRVAVEPLRKSAPFAVFCMLYSHLTTMPCMLVDYLFIKDRVLLQALHPSLSGLAAIIVSYAAFYFLWVHMNHAINGGHYPYPFLYHFSPVGWVMFFFGIVIFLLSLLATQYALYNATMFIAG